MPTDDEALTVDEALARLLSLWEAEPGTPEAGQLVALLEALGAAEDAAAGGLGDPADRRDG